MKQSWLPTFWKKKRSKAHKRLKELFVISCVFRKEQKAAGFRINTSKRPTYWRTFAHNKKYQLQSNESKSIHLNAGIILRSSSIPEVTPVPHGGEIESLRGKKIGCELCAERFVTHNHSENQIERVPSNWPKSRRGTKTTRNLQIYESNRSDGDHEMNLRNLMFAWQSLQKLAIYHVPVVSLAPTFLFRDETESRCNKPVYPLPTLHPWVNLTL